MRKLRKNKHTSMEGQLDIFNDYKKEVEASNSLETIVDHTMDSNSDSVSSIKDKRISIKELMKQCELEKTQTEQKINNYENFSITSQLITQLPYITVREMFYGINNIHDNYTFGAEKKFDIGKLYEKMNPTEILALWTAIGRKTRSYHDIVNQRNFIDAMSKLVALGHDIPSISQNAPDDKKGQYNIGTVHGRAKKNTDIYSTEPYEMKKRLSSIDEEVIQEITAQLKRPGRYTEKERNTCYGAPGYDSSNLLTDPNSYSKGPTHAAKMEYVDVIMNIIKGVYNSNVKSNK